MKNKIKIVKKQNGWQKLLKFSGVRGTKRGQSDRSRQELSSAYLIAKIGVDTVGFQTRPRTSRQKFLEKRGSQTGVAPVISSDIGPQTRRLSPIKAFLQHRCTMLIWAEVSRVFVDSSTASYRSWACLRRECWSKARGRRCSSIRTTIHASFRIRGARNGDRARRTLQALSGPRTSSNLEMTRSQTIPNFSAKFPSNFAEFPKKKVRRFFAKCTDFQRWARFPFVFEKDWTTDWLI